MSLMNASLQVTPTIWWASHHDQFHDWNTIKTFMIHRFSPSEKISYKIPIYDGCTRFQKHIQNFCSTWKDDGVPVIMWKHQFIHTLGTILQGWYIKEEMKRQTIDWDMMIDQFCKYFSFHGID